MTSEFAALRLEEDALNFDVEQAHARVCDLRSTCCEVELRLIAARALRRARAAEIVAAWQAGDLTEMQAARLLGWSDDLLRLRELLAKIIKDCQSRWKMRLPLVLLDE